MKTAYAYWNGRIAPVFDSAQQIHVVDSDGTKVISEQGHALPNGEPFQKAAYLAEHDVKTLVCGAISRPLHEWLVTRGVNVIAFIAGELREVMQARQEGTLENNAFAMPGCGRRMRGMGRGMRRGMGAGLGRNAGFGANCGMRGGMGFGNNPGKGNGRGMGRGRNNQN